MKSGATAATVEPDAGDCGQTAAELLAQVIDDETMAAIKRFLGGVAGG